MPETPGGDVVRPEDVRAAYVAQRRAGELETDLPVMVWRPLSHRLAAWLAPTPVTPDAVSLLTVALALALVPAALTLGPLAAAGIGAAHQLLDCVDGDLARATGRHSALGTKLETLSGLLFSTAMLLTLGLLGSAAAQGWLAAHGVALSLGAACLVLIHRVQRDEAHRDAPDHAPQVPDGLPPPLRWVRRAVAGLEHLYVPALAICAVSGGLPALLVAAVAYSALVFFVVQLELFSDAL